MKKLFQTFCLLAFLLSPWIGSAIIVDDYSVATNAPTGDYAGSWDYVYNYKNSSSVAVGSYWILTAAHVADDGGAGTVVIDGVSHYQQEIIFHSAADDPDNVNLADLALVRFDKPFPGYYPLYFGDFPGIESAAPWYIWDETDNRLSSVMIGYGRTGTVYSTYYTETPPGNGIKRWGTQKIDETDSQDYLIVDYRETPSVTNTTYNSGIKMDFDQVDTDYEAGVGVYDSGGGTFVVEGGVWKLAGINTIRYGSDLNYTGTFAVSVPDYEAWITETMAGATDDDDSDGIPNEWEYAQSGSTVGVDASADSDADGLTGLEEYQNDTDPDDSDSDDDGMSDGWEVLYDLDPLDDLDAGQDLDVDTLVNSNEYLLKTDPLDPDMDGDGALDGWEYHGTRNTAYGSEATSITNADSDADGLFDGIEMGITHSNGYITNPNSADTDGDSMPDGWEVGTGLDPVDDSNEENDSDEDGFTDSEEWIADTNPTESDSHLKIDAFVNIAQMGFSSSTNRQYQIEYRTDLMDSNGVWQVESGMEWFDADSTQTVKAVSSSGSNRFYRLRVTRP